jgi:hypothetical protein
LPAALVKAIVSILPGYMLPSEADVRLSVPVLIFALIVALSAGVFFPVALPHGRPPIPIRIVP